MESNDESVRDGVRESSVKRVTEFVSERLRLFVTPQPSCREATAIPPPPSPYQASVSSCLERHPPSVEDIRVPLSPSVSSMQQAIVEVMASCLKVRT